MNDGRRLGLRLAAVAAIAAGILAAQTPGQPPAPSPSPTAPAANLNQIMRGLFFPLSNVVFATQSDNPADIKTAPEPSRSTDPFTGVFGKWEAVENSALVLSDSADLLMTPGRKCSNGREVPVGNADWIKMVNQLREAGIVAYKAAQTKNMDNMIMASDVLNTACANCHNKYRARTRCQ